MNNLKIKNSGLLLILFCCLELFSQPGKDGALTVTSAGLVVNRYAPVMANISAASSTIAVTPGPSFSLCSGDLIMVYQAQGAAINTTNSVLYGDITSYNSAGLYEFKYVQTVNGNTITTQSPFSNSYNVAAGRVQVIKVPQYSTLTVNPNAGITAKVWKDTTIASVSYRFGGLVVLHAATVVNNGTISSSHTGFRGGIVAVNQLHTTGITAYVSTVAIQGGEKGESIFGAQADYDLNGGRFCRGAPANGGGGGTATNSAGGGGANGFNNNIWTGQGIMIVDANNPLTAWSLDPGYIANGNALTNSSGGGRGGYSWANVNANALVDAPGATIWLGDNRREVGGLGGRPLTNINSESRIYFGGGGGAGEANNNGGTSGGNGGGIVYIIAGTSISGTGVINANGASVPFSSNCNCDGQGGGGGGGSIVIKTASIANTQTVTCRGGIGGSQNIVTPPGLNTESEGSGGGGGGGFVAISAGGSVPDVEGGSNGISLSLAVTEMISNGGTKGATGHTSTVSSSFISYIPPQIFSNAPVCSGDTLTLSTSSIGVTSYIWAGPNSFSSSVQNPVIAGASTLASGIYTLFVTHSNCTLSNTIHITVNTTPTLILSSDNPSVCAGTSAILTASGAVSYTWLPVNVQNYSVTVSPSASIIYTVTGANVNGCLDIAYIPQTVFPLPSPSVASSNSLSCTGYSVELIASGAQTYTWYPGAISASSITVSPTQNTTYTLTGTNSNGCTNFVTYLQSVANNPTLSVSSNSFLVCPGEVFLVNVFGASTYSWFPSGFIGSSFTNSLNSSSIYTVTGASVNNCTAVTTVSVFVKPSPTLNIVSHTITCASLGSSTVNAVGGIGPFSYSWNPVIQTGSVAVGMYPGTHSITVSDIGTGCTYTHTENFLPLIPLTSTISSSPILSCNGVNTGTASVLVSGGSAIQNYTWTSSAGSLYTQTVFSLAAGVSTLQVVDALTFCSITSTFVIMQPPAITLNISASTSSVCLGGSITFSALGSGGTGNFSYQWIDGPANQLYTVSDSISGSPVYTLTGLDDNSCMASRTLQVQFVDNPTITVTSISICPQGSGTLTASGATSYSWHTGAVGQHLTVSPGTTSSYSVTGSALGCTTEATGTVAVLVAPVASITSNSPLCDGDNLLISGSAGTGYLWSGPTGFSASVQSNTINPVLSSNSGNYFFTVTAVNGCTASSTHSVHVNPRPIVSVGGNTVCEGQNMQLTANFLNGAIYFWTGPMNFTAVDQSPLITQVSEQMTGNYTLHLTSAEGCTNQIVTTASVVTQPLPTFTVNSPLCAGSQLSLSAGGGSSYGWYTANGLTLHQSNVVLNNVAVLASGIYTLVVQKGPCNYDTTFHVLVHPLPIADISGPFDFCEFSPVQLSADGGQSYAWAGPQGILGSSNPLVIPSSSAVAGSYSVTVTDLNGCSSFTSTLVTILPAPSGIVLGDTVCFGETAQLIATGGVSYHWTGPGGFNSDSAVATVINVGPSSAGNYSVTITGSNSCSLSSVVSLVAYNHALPQPAIEALNRACINSTLQLAATGGISYQWSGPGLFFSNQQTISLPVTGTAVAGIYTVSATNSNNCSASATLMVDVFPAAEVLVELTKNNACVPFCTDITLHNSSNAPILSSSLFLDGKPINNNQHCFYAPGNFQIYYQITDTNQCKASGIYTVTVHPKPEAYFVYYPLHPVANVDKVVFNNFSKSNGNTQWTWFFGGNNTDSVVQKDIERMFERSGSYPVVLIVKNQWGCIDTLIKVVVVKDEYSLYVPNVFTPNNDQLNDFFQPKGHGFSTYNLEIYDRWGEQIFSTTRFEEGWDGTFRGKECKSDSYIWKIVIKDISGKTRELVGHVLLLRG